MKEKKFIGIDLGAESGRCVVAVLDDNKITLKEVHRFPTYNIKDKTGRYWDILAIYEEIIVGLTKASKNFGRKFNGIGIDTWAVDYVLIDSNERILINPHHYRDERTDNIMEQAFKTVPKEKIYSRTGIQFVQFNTLFQLLSEKKNKINLLTINDKMLMIPDFLNFLLAGEKKTEYTNASTTGLLDSVSREWAWDLIDEFKIPRRIFPEIVKPGTILGNLLPSVAERVGLNSDIPVIAGATHDTASAVVSIPSYIKNWAFLSSGTWSLMGIELEQPLLSQKAMEYNFSNEGGAENTIRFLKNILGLWPVQECRRYWNENSIQYSYNELAGLAGKNGPAKAWVDFDDNRFYKEGGMPEKILEYLEETGQTIDNNVGFVIRVILESLAFSYRNTLMEIEKITGKSIKILHAVGGGIQNELLTQLTADALGRNVLAGPLEGTIIGNIGMQAIAIGAVSDLKSWRMVVANSFKLKMYEPKNADYFNENEQRYKYILRH